MKEFEIIFKTIQYIGTPIALCAFAIAIFSHLYSNKLKNKIDLIKTIPKNERATIIEKEIETYKIVPEKDNLTKEQKFELMRIVLTQRIHRLKVISITTIILSLIISGTVLATFYIDKLNSNSNSNKTTILDNKNKAQEKENLSNNIDQSYQKNFFASSDKGIFIENYYKGISEEKFSQISLELGITKVALKNFFYILKQRPASWENLDNTLRKIAWRYVVLNKFSQVQVDYLDSGNFNENDLKNIQYTNLNLIENNNKVDLYLITNKSNVMRGESFELDIRIDESSGISGYVFTLTYPSELVEINKVIDPESVNSTFLLNDVYPEVIIQNDVEAYFDDIHKATHRVKASAINTKIKNKILFAGTYVDFSQDNFGGGFYGRHSTIFKVFFKVKNDIELGIINFELQQTKLCNYSAGWGKDLNGNLKCDKEDYEPVPILYKGYPRGSIQWETQTLVDDVGIVLNSFDENPKTSVIVEIND